MTILGFHRDAAVVRITVQCRISNSLTDSQKNGHTTSPGNCWLQARIGPCMLCKEDLIDSQSVTMCSRHAARFTSVIHALDCRVNEGGRSPIWIKINHIHSFTVRTMVVH